MSALLAIFLVLLFLVIVPVLFKVVIIIAAISYLIHFFRQNSRVEPVDRYHW